MATAIRFCEAEVRSFEYVNVASNLAFLVSAVLGLRLARRRGLDRTFYLVELALIVVFVGSVIFHSTQSWYGELLDEIPMSVLALCYLYTLDGVHRLTRPPWRTLTLALGSGGAVAGMAVYILFRNHVLFTTLFTVQVVCPALIACASGPSLGCVRTPWYAFLGLILVAKGIWEYEQHLWRSGNCPRSALDPAYWAHAAWHVGSAAAHHAAIVYHGDLQVAAASARSRAKVP